MRSLVSASVCLLASATPAAEAPVGSQEILCPASFRLETMERLPMTMGSYVTSKRWALVETSRTPSRPWSNLADLDGASVSMRCRVALPDSREDSSLSCNNDAPKPMSSTSSQRVLPLKLSTGRYWTVAFSLIRSTSHFCTGSSFLRVRSTAALQLEHVMPSIFSTAQRRVTAHFPLSRRA